jgi:DNA-binding CsgD family transcriptional regulator
VLTLLAAQLDTKEIADQLGIAPATVNYHKRNIYQKLAVHSEEGLGYTAVTDSPVW